MLKSLHIDGYYVDFSKHLPFVFPKGITCITGRNGRGKSSIIEMVRYALFGSAALRRPASDYKKLDVELAFTVRGEDYTVVRAPRGVTLYKGNDVPLATGTTPVNAAVINLFGYNLKVFDIANCCNQNQVMAFSDNMKPTERKQMIDQTVGLGAIDEVAKTLGEEALVLSKEFKFLEGRWTSGKPEEPTTPEGLWPLPTITDNLARARKSVADLNHLRGQLSALNPVAPVEPVYKSGEAINTVALTSLIETAKAVITDQTTAAARRREALVRVQALPELNFGPKPEFDLEPPTALTMPQLEASIASRREVQLVENELGRLELPTMTPEQIEEAQDNLQLWNRYLAKQELLKHGDTTCPNCQTSFPNEHSALAHYADVPAEMEKPSATSDMLARQLSLQGNIERKAQLLAQVEEVKLRLIQGDADLLKALREYNDALMTYGQAVVKWEAQVEAARVRSAERAAALETLAATDKDKDAETEVSAWKARLAVLESDLRVLQTFERDTERYTAEVQRKAEIQAKYDLFLQTDPEGQLTGWERAEAVRRDYDNAYNNYTQWLTMWEADTAKMQELQEQIDDLKAGKKALVDLKARVKAHLLPSLNTVASLLVAEMTGGEIRNIKLDDDFDIMVDNLAIEALSGSGKAVANLALRLGLGQVLTNRVFSVFMGDELDASMDNERAAYLMECLRRLRSQVSQIVVVTHKQHDADQQINLN